MEVNGCNAKHLKLDVEWAGQALETKSWVNREATNERRGWYLVGIKRTIFQNRLMIAFAEIDCPVFQG